jgi:rubredoxin
MPIFVDHKTVINSRQVRTESDGCTVGLTHFINGSKNGKSPQAMLVEEGPFRNLRTHYHSEDEFQIFIQGDGINGRHKISPIQVHFACKFTPYGPIVASKEGCSFITLRCRTDSGAKFLPECREELENISLRDPWQKTSKLLFPEKSDEIETQLLEGLQNNSGLAAIAFRFPPSKKTISPETFLGDGQFLVVINGSLIHENMEYEPLSIIYLEAGEESLLIESGKLGLDMLVLNFPESSPINDQEFKNKKSNFKVWQCVLCGFIYDESIGIPEEGIAPGTLWSEVPVSFGCPDCSSLKNEFIMVEV